MDFQRKFKIMNLMNLAKKTIYFKKLDDMNFNAIMHCLQARVINVNKGDTVVNIGDKISYAYLILAGSLRSTSFDELGNLFINLDYEGGEIFGLVDIINNEKTFSNQLIALEDSTILLLDKFRLLNPTLNRCQRHIDLMKACFEELARQNKEYYFHKNILSLSSTKEKVMAYLTEYSKKVKSLDFYIPYSRIDLALYLGVERSALSYELSCLKKMDKIDFSKNHFILKKPKK